MIFSCEENGFKQKKTKKKKINKNQNTSEKQKKSRLLRQPSATEIVIFLTVSDGRKIRGGFLEKTFDKIQHKIKLKINY